jgi:glyoxylase-like metal-dependent hydrolase (beta-lactamase superfamily II)
LIIKQLTLGPIQANCYILGCDQSRQAAVIDPGDEADKILMALAESKLTVNYIINTHGHFDHVGANARLKGATDAQLLIHALDEPMLKQLSASASAWGLKAENSPAPDQYLEDGLKLTFGEITLEAIHTPGHSPGGVSLFTDGKVFVGDTLFAGSIGRTDLPGGDYNTLISSIQTRLFTLDDDVEVFPGHMGTTTIGTEKRHNPFCRVL